MIQGRQTFPSFLARNLINISIAAAILVLYLPILYQWYDGWLNKNISTEHEYFSHGLIGFPYAAYVTWQHRKKWQRLTNQTNLWGGILLGIGIFFYLSGAPEFVYFSLPVTLTGICLWLKGMPGLKLQAFPLLLVFLATPNPIPYLITPYTLWLQKFIAAVAGFILIQLGINVQIEGIHLTINNRLVEVAPYCAGLKMLFTSLYVGLILLHWTGNLGNRTRVISLLTGAAGISVTANIIRNTLLSWFHGMGQDQNFEWLHSGRGGDLYSVLMLLAIVGLLIAMEKLGIGSNPSQPLEGEENREESQIET